MTKMKKRVFHHFIAGVAWTAFLMGRDPKVFVRPEQFEPERFLNASKDTPTNIPFQLTIGFMLLLLMMIGCDGIVSLRFCF
jgi:hypothetical protein